MTVRRRPLLVALLALAVVPAPAGAVTVGISDQHAAMFQDPLYAPLHIHYARLVVPWNVAIKNTWATKVVTDWLLGALADHVEPHIAFSSPDYTKYYKDHGPSPRQYLRAFQAFHHRWPGVKVFTPWNEENFYYQPTATRPWLAARYYDIARDACRTCRIVAADLLDQPNLPSWLARFKASLRHREPRLWGLHNYQDVNRRRKLSQSWTLRYARMVKGRIWVTEGGGIVGLRSPANGRTVFPYSPSRAASSMRYLFRLLRMPQVRDRYTRAYVYCFYGAWNRHEQTNRWDSGLLGLDGRPRPAYSVLQNLVKTQG